MSSAFDDLFVPHQGFWPLFLRFGVLRLGVVLAVRSIQEAQLCCSVPDSPRAGGWVAGAVGTD